jgi:hypothetical protein
MKLNTTVSMSLASAALFLAGLASVSCSGTEETSAAPSQSNAAAPAGAPAAQEPLLPPDTAAIPSQEEADQAAEKTIDETNADEEMEKLEKETEGGGG